MQFHPINAPLVFDVVRQKPELIRPPYKLTYSNTTKSTKLLLSDIDDQDTIRIQPFLLQFYRHNPSMKDKNPAKIIKDALTQALVFYYPFAGRLKEGPNRKLFVDCMDDGLMFMEADVDFTLEQLNNTLPLSFSFLKELIYDVPDSEEILNSPLLHIQVIRLKCGGFIMAVRLNHTMSDGFGITQFISAVAEIAKGATSPSILPIWQRELLNARQPPRVTCKLDEYNYNQVPINFNASTFDNMSQRSFFFGPKETSIIKQMLPPNLRRKTTPYEVVSAFLWRYRTIALGLNAEDNVQFASTQDARNKFNPRIPIGYYGNVIAFSMAFTTAGFLCNNPLEYALQLIKNTKSNVTEEYMRSVADLMVIKGRPVIKWEGTYFVSDWRTLKYDQIDFGWGKPVYIYIDHPFVTRGNGNFYLPFVNKKGEKGIIIPISLPTSAMERFSNDLNHIFTYN